MLASIKQSPNYKWWVFCTVATGTFMSVMGHGSVLIALPAIARHFDASLTTVVWIAIGEALTISALDSPAEPKIAPLLGQHTEEVLKDLLGFGEEELAELKEQRLFG